MQLSITDSTGHTVLDTENGVSDAQVEKKFQEMIGNGMLAYDADRSETLRSSDSGSLKTREHVVMTPQIQGG